MHTSPLFGMEAERETSDDHYTPRWIFDTLKLKFDIDVASPAEPIPYIPAGRFYTIADDGLTQTWAGRVWMNPPYSAATAWVDRFLEHGCGVALLPAAKSAWFFRLWESADGIVALPRSAQHFAGGKSIAYPVILAAMSPDCVAALANIGRVR